MNASELTNQELFNELYRMHEHPKDPIVQAKLENVKFTTDTKVRSRNNGITQSILQAGQSVHTLSFYDASQTTITNQQSHDFYEGIRNEIVQHTDEVILQLMSDYQPSKYSSKRNGVIAGYGANTNQGIARYLVLTV